MVGFFFVSKYIVDYELEIVLCTQNNSHKIANIYCYGRHDNDLQIVILFDLFLNDKLQNEYRIKTVLDLFYMKGA